MKKEIEKSIAEISSVIDILQATTEFYKKMECVDANDFMVLNDLVCAGLRDKLNALIPLVKEL